jgi:L-lactate dehydrogenase (cytochrome)
LWECCPHLIQKLIMGEPTTRHANAADGGRQLDGAPSPMAVLPSVLEAVDGRCEVWVDGGIRSGQSVLKAIAMGADAAMVGRPWLYGLGAYGEDGVRLSLEMIHKELDISMAFCGKTRIADVDGSIIFTGNGKGTAKCT